MVDKIKLTLHHDYLMIEEGRKKMQLPVRCAKLIKDMYALRNAKNETKDIKHYSSDECSNPEYELSIFIMNAPFNSELQWVKKNIKPILQEE